VLASKAGNGGFLAMKNALSRTSYVRIYRSIMYIRTHFYRYLVPKPPKSKTREAMAARMGRTKSSSCATAAV